MSLPTKELAEPAPADPGTPRGPVQNPYLERMRRPLPAIIALGTLALLWQLSAMFLNPLATPPLATIGESIWAIITDWDRMQHLLRTGVRILGGLGLAFMIGATIGIITGFSNRIRTYAGPILYFIQGIPALSWVVFAVLWFQDSEIRIAFIMVMVTFPSFALFIQGAVRGVPQDFIQLGQAFRSSRWQQFRYVVLPSIIPTIMSAWSVNLGNGVRAVVVAELVGATIGVGNQLLLAQSLFNMADAMAWTLLLVGLLLIFQQVLTVIESRLLSWRPIGERA
jgi:NitT/TauT family transport system permease protein